MRYLTFTGWLLLAALPLAELRAQGSACLLVPVPLAQRVARATLAVEARVLSQRVVRAAGNHLVAENELEVYKVFRGDLPTGDLRVRTLGGALGDQLEAVSGALQLRAGQQGVFLLEADPAAPGEWRAYAGPQGFLAYDLTTGSAQEPFGRYASIGGELYAALQAEAGRPYRVVRANAELSAATVRLSARAGTARGTAAPIIDGFSPGSVVAGTSAATASGPGVITITGTGFGATRGAGFVQFRNADSPGSGANPNYTRPLDSDYLSWSDTRIELRVPSESQSGNTAGTGFFQVAADDGTLATSPGALTVLYALSNVVAGTSPPLTYRPRLVNDDAQGGYTLQYASSFPVAAQAPFERALQTWRCATGLNRRIGAATTVNVTANDGVNVVRFANANELTAGVLGVTYSYYSGCGSGASFNWQLVETDYAYSPAFTWNYGPAAPAGNQFDFETVALHEQGHGGQLTHIISAAGVMNFSVGNGQSRRALDAATDVAGNQNVVDFSVGSTSGQRCNRAVFTASQAGCGSGPLPVRLTAFAARYEPSRGTSLRWSTASEQQSAYFGVESRADSSVAWREILRQPAAGTSPTPRQYAALDPRPLAGRRYYRLRQVDQDGTAAYSAVVVVVGAEAEAAGLLAYPNPVPAGGTLRLHGPLGGPGAVAQVRLLDAVGRCVARATAPAGVADFDLPLTSLAPGLYLVEWTGAAGAVVRQRVVVE